MKPRQYRLIWALLLLLSLPAPGYSLDLEGTFRMLALMLLAVLAGIAVLIGALVATVELLRQLWQPEAADHYQQRIAKLRLAGLTLPASVVTWGLVAWLTYDPYGSWYYPAVPLALLVGLVVCLLLWWRQRPTAAKAMLAGFLVAGIVATVTHLLATKPIRQPATPLGLLGNPAFNDVSSLVAPLTAIDTSYVYTDVEQMPGFRGGSTALRRIVGNELHYPDVARNRGVSGEVQITFTVQPAGGLAYVYVTHSLSPECDAEAVRVVKLLAPYFSPGSQHGKLVQVREKLSFGFGPAAAPVVPTSL